MSQNLTQLVQAAASVAAGAVIGWSSSALTLGGRVEAIEKGQARIEALMLKLIEDRGLPGGR